MLSPVCTLSNLLRTCLLLCLFIFRPPPGWEPDREGRSREASRARNVLLFFYILSKSGLRILYEFFSMNERLCFPATNQRQIAHQANGPVDMRCALRTDVKANVIGETLTQQLKQCLAAQLHGRPNRRPHIAVALSQPLHQQPHMLCSPPHPRIPDVRKDLVHPPPPRPAASS